jgi:hypothetical protein
MFVCWQLLLSVLHPGGKGYVCLPVVFCLSVVCLFVGSPWTQCLCFFVGSVCLSVVCLFVGSVCCKSCFLDSKLIFVCQECLFVSSMFVGWQCLL